MDIEQNSPVRNINEKSLAEEQIRPYNLGEFIGQHKIKDNLKVFIESAKARSAALDHVLFHGPPGLGKTTLSRIIAKELNSSIKTTSGPMLNKTGDLAAILSNLKKHDVLFIDEIHRLNAAVEELLYPAMEDYSIDIIIGEGPSARTVKIGIAKFTLVGATTRLGLLTNPLIDRFGITFKLDFYSNEELQSVITRTAAILEVKIAEDAAFEIARSSRGTPRIAVKLTRRIRDYLYFAKQEEIDVELVKLSLQKLGVDALGLDVLDYKYMRFIAEHYNGGPVGIDTIAAGLFEEKDTIEDAVEPYLIQIGFISRTARGRVLTSSCLKHIGVSTQPKNTLF